MSLKEDIIITLKANAPLEFNYDRANRYGSDHDEKLVCDLLNGEMHSNQKAPYDFIVQGQKLDLKVGNSINLSCLSHNDVDYILASKDGTKFKYLEHSELIDMFEKGMFKPTKYSSPGWWPIVIVRNKDGSLAGEVNLWGEHRTKFVELMKQHQFGEDLLIRKNRTIEFGDNKYDYKVMYSDDYVFVYF